MLSYIYNYLFSQLHHYLLEETVINWLILRVLASLESSLMCGKCRRLIKNKDRTGFESNNTWNFRGNVTNNTLCGKYLPTDQCPCIVSTSLLKNTTGISLVVQGLRLQAPNIQGTDSIPSQGRSHMMHGSAKKERKIHTIMASNWTDFQNSK